MMLSPLSPHIFPRQNDDGFDLHGYQDVARKFKCDMLVCLGESVYAWKENWLVPIVEAWKRYGPGMYGFFSSFLVRPHLNTTAFAIDPVFLMGWPTITTHYSRYQAEHGKYSLWKHLAEFKRPTKLVTWDGVYDPPQWRYPKNILWRGDQSNCLLRCNHLDRYDAAEPETRKRWAYSADTLK